MRSLSTIIFVLAFTMLMVSFAGYTVKDTAQRYNTMRTK